MRYTGRRQLSVRAEAGAGSSTGTAGARPPIDIDTLRIVVDWRCNLRCPYCCNRQKRVRAQFTPHTLDEIAWWSYRTFCITGGEPLLFPRQVAAVCERAFPAPIILYSNGLLLTRDRAVDLCRWGVTAINVGLHAPERFDWLIRHTLTATFALPLAVRFHVWERYRAEIERFRHLGLNVRFWRLDDCDRPNEHRVVLQQQPGELPENPSAREDRERNPQQSSQFHSGVNRQEEYDR